MKKITEGKGADVTMDASGAEPAIRAGLLSTRPGGKYVSIGRGSKDVVGLPFFEIMVCSFFLSFYTQFLF